MNFDISSFLIGLILGVAVLAIIKLNSLKKLSLDLEKLGISLGIEGFTKTDEKPDSSGGVHIEGGISGQTGDIAGNIDKSTSYGPQTTLRQNINDLSSIVQNIGGILDGCYEQKSLIYAYKYGGDIDQIQDDIQEYLSSGWFVSSTLLLPDYEGNESIWVVLSRKRLSGNGAISTVERK